MTSEVKKKTERYSPEAVEAKWKKRWSSSGLHEPPDVWDKPNFYFVTMYPYPSGELHVGHWYAMAPSDAAARFLRMRGHNVLFPMGFDAFGLPAENAAIKRKMHPAKWTEKNMAHMRDQFRMMGASIDWRREVVTCYPEYYRWNQWIFLKFLEKGLAYRAKAPVNWCPKDQTVLANEQVIAGRCERCETPVVRRDLEQWFFRITDYADELLRYEGIDWPERVRVMQTNWIGRSEGAEISFADYVWSTYGTGAIMAVPAHDERDFDFAKRHRLDIREVISPDGAERRSMTAPYLGEGVMVRSGPFTGTQTEEGRRAVAEDAKRRGIGGPSVIYRLRDWLISRQRYWGTPIPLVYCDTDGAVPVPYDQLPVELPRDVEITGRGGSPLARVASFVNTTCPKCGKPARRDTDTMDRFVDSSWYVYRYPDPKYDRLFMNAEIGRLWLPVARYTGGIEHAILHLLYARFVAKALRDMGYLWFGEPFKHLRNQGTIVFGGRKMSKSHGNVQAPDEYVARYGADSLRLFLMFMGPWTDGSDWDAAGIEGTHRFLNRVWTIGIEKPAGSAGDRDEAVDRAVHRTIQKVTEDLEGYRFNTAISAMIELSTTLSHARGSSPLERIDTLVLLLAPL